MRHRPDPIENAGTDPDATVRRSGGSVADPHGGWERMVRGGPDPDPIAEMATIGDAAVAGNSDRPRLAAQPGGTPGFGPDEFSRARHEGDPTLGIDPREAASRAGNKA